MEKTLVLNRLRDTVVKLLTLKPEQFRYDDFVHSTDPELKCGTVCCVAGWYPQWFGNTGLAWKFEEDFQEILLHAIDDNHRQPIKAALMTYHGINQSLVECLFYGYEYDGIRALNGTYSDLSEVITLWKKIIIAIENDAIVWN